MGTLSIQEIEAARQAFERMEPRDLFYRVATELVRLALEGKTSLSVPEALAVLLQTWNKMFYHYRKFDSQHFATIEQRVHDHYSTDAAALRGAGEAQAFLFPAARGRRFEVRAVSTLGFGLASRP